MSIAVEQGDRCELIRLEGAIDISCASELKAILLEALKLAARKDERELSIALDRVTDLDVTAVQLLWAAEREAKALGAGIKVVGQLPQPVLTNLKSVGLEGFPVVA